MDLDSERWIHHNMILFHDGLDDWNTSESEISTDVSTKKDFAMKRLYSLPLDCNSAASAKKIEKHYLSDRDRYYIRKSIDENGVRRLSKLPQDSFYRLLVNHFDIRFRMNSIKWQKNMKSKPKEI